MIEANFINFEKNFETWKRDRSLSTARDDEPQQRVSRYRRSRCVTKREALVGLFAKRTRLLIFFLSRRSGYVQEWTGCWLPVVRGLIYTAHFRLPRRRPRRPVPPPFFVRYPPMLVFCDRQTHTHTRMQTHWHTPTQPTSTTNHRPTNRPPLPLGTCGHSSRFYDSISCPVLFLFLWIYSLRTDVNIRAFTLE